MLKCLLICRLRVLHMSILCLTDDIKASLICHLFNVYYQCVPRMSLAGPTYDSSFTHVCYSCVCRMSFAGTTHMTSAHNIYVTSVLADPTHDIDVVYYLSYQCVQTVSLAINQCVTRTDNIHVAHVCQHGTVARQNTCIGFSLINVLTLPL